MATIWENLKKSLGNAGTAWQQTQASMYTAPTSSGKTGTSDNKTGTGAKSGSTGQNAVGAVTDEANRIAESLGDVTADDGAGAGGAGGAYGAYADAIARQESLLKEQWALAEKQRKAALDATINANNQAADQSLKEAYIANMLAKRNLPQQLKALGVSGGATETTAADIQNTYMNNRFGIEANRNNANRQARLAYDNGVAGDYSNYLAKAYELQGDIASRAVAAGGKSTNTGTSSATGTGYKLGAFTAKDEVDLYQQLMNAGYSQEAVERYLIAQGIIRESTPGRSER